MKVLIDEQSIKNRVAEVAKQIDSDFANKDFILVCILKGAFMFTAELAKNIKSENVSFEFMAVSSYGNEKRSSGKIKIVKDIDVDVQGKNIVIIEDIVDTGLTMEFLVGYFKNKGANCIKVCALLDKKDCRKVEARVDYCCFDIEDRFVIGYGLDYAQKYRNLPYIAEYTGGNNE
ncbi:MAG: hypoxanthine phosphoribosyltransferase [Candidatus Muirbacterium halophilum]|nr:hypoxanthine phosphoribosyltransferase [Candidatus Muirbacterium halophilum]